MPPSRSSWNSVWGQRVTGQVVWHADHNHQVGVMLSEWSWQENRLLRFAERLG
ncbi:hypothetical protein AB0K49_04495 [Streptomyces decoyicus]|uniref:hypothetical protein n=1 Tax=Streptomyces decoyicus TaxID=249567 RepID=UPI00345D60EC